MVTEQRLIDVNKAIAEMNRVDTSRIWDDKDDIVEVCVNILYTAPTVDAVEVVHAKWIAASDTYQWRCSHCNRKRGRVKSRYCCNCGAKMDFD